MATISKKITPTDIKSYSLTLPAKEVGKLFADIGKGSAMLKFRDDKSNSYDIEYRYYAKKNSYGLGKGWNKFLSARGLKAGDFVYIGGMVDGAYQISLAPILHPPEQVAADPERVEADPERTAAEALAAEAERIVVEALLKLRNPEEVKAHKLAHHPEEIPPRQVDLDLQIQVCKPLEVLKTHPEEEKEKPEDLDLQIQVYKPSEALKTHPEEKAEKPEEEILDPNPLQVYKPLEVLKVHKPEEEIPVNPIPPVIDGAPLSDLDFVQEVVDRVRKDPRFTGIVAEHFNSAKNK